MAELRSVDPRILKPNPNNPRRTSVPAAMDEQLLASIKAIGVIQPPRVREQDDQLIIIAGNRRTQAAIAAGLSRIDVVVCDADEAHDAMSSVSENLVRASMTSVDIWRAIEALEKRGWNEQAIADALALPPRTIKRLKLLAHLHPPMLDAMAQGSMPNEEQLRTIAAAKLEEQIQVWKKHKPKKGQDIYWHEVARALSKRRMPFSAAKFGEDLAKAYGVVWEDDLFAPAGEESRYTTNVEGFFGAQQEWMANNLPPERATLLPQDEHGRPVLPKKAEHVYGKPTKTDIIGHYVEPHSGEVKTIAYRMPETKKPAKPEKGGDPAAVADDTPTAKPRPDVTQKGLAMIGDYRTDALHQALKENAIPDQTLIALLILALAGNNVSVHSGGEIGHWDRQAIGAAITEGGAITADDTAIRAAARTMLTGVLSCRDNMSNSGTGARIAGEAIGAAAFLPSMATEDFISCLSRQALETAARAEKVRVEARVKDTRAGLVEHFANKTWHYPGALFALSAQDLADHVATIERRAAMVASRTELRDHPGPDDGETPDDLSYLDEDEQPDPDAHQHLDYAEAAD